MKHLFHRLLYGIEYVFIILFYMISFIFSWILALIVIPLLINFSDGLNPDYFLLPAWPPNLRVGENSPSL